MLNSTHMLAKLDLILSNNSITQHIYISGPFVLQIGLSEMEIRILHKNKIQTKDMFGVYLHPGFKERSVLLYKSEIGSSIFQLSDIDVMFCLIPNVIGKGNYMLYPYVVKSGVTKSKLKQLFLEWVDKYKSLKTVVEECYSTLGDELFGSNECIPKERFNFNLKKD